MAIYCSRLRTVSRKRMSQPYICFPNVPLFVASLMPCLSSLKAAKEYHPRRLA